MEEVQQEIFNDLKDLTNKEMEERYPLKSYDEIGMIFNDKRVTEMLRFLEKWISEDNAVTRRYRIDEVWRMNDMCRAYWLSLPYEPDKWEKRILRILKEKKK